MGRGGFVFGKSRVCVDDALDRTLEQHEDHHNAEYLQTVSGHVHHNRVHGDLFRRGHGDFPRFLHLQCVGLFGLLGAGLLLLTLDNNVSVLGLLYEGLETHLLAPIA